MSSPGQNTSLSPSARLLCFLGPPVIVLTTAYGSPKTGGLAPLAFLPTVYAYRKWSEANKAAPSRRGKLEPMIWTYFLTGTLGVAAVSLVQMATGYGLATLLFGNDGVKPFMTEFFRSAINDLSPEELAQRAALASSWRNHAFNALLFFGAAGLFEEALKLLPILYARRRERQTSDAKPQRDRAYLDYVLASSLSFGVIEGIGFLYASCVHGKETGSKLLLTVVERLVLGSSGHMLMAVLSALRATRRDYYGDSSMSWWSVIGPAALIHGTYDFVAMCFSASEGNVGWIHPTEIGKTTAMLTMACGMWLTTAGLVRREWKMIQERDKK